MKYVHFSQNESDKTLSNIKARRSIPKIKILQAYEETLEEELHCSSSPQ